MRWNAARALGADPASVAALAAALETEPVARVREAIMTALMRIGNQESVKALLPYLREQDAARRGAAIEALQALPDATAPFLSALLHDADSDVRILAVELVRGMPAAEATRLLCDILEHEPHPNVCASAVDALAEVGTPGCIAGAGGLRAALRRHAIPAVRHIDCDHAHFQRQGLKPAWRGPARKIAPRTFRRKMSAGCASFSIAAPECCLPRTSATTSTAACTSASRRPARSPSRPISRCCAPGSTARSSTSSMPSRSTRPTSSARTISFAA